MRRTFWSWAIVAIAALAPAMVLAGEQTDKQTAEQIATYLRDSGKMQKYSVGVKYRNGTVWLSGRVANDQQMQTALDVISEIEGIEQIVNNMAVAPSSSNVKQTSASRPSARRTAANIPDMSIEVPANASGTQQMPPADEEATPAGYHKLAAKRAARHGHPLPVYAPGPGNVAPAAYDQPHMPNYAWPSYAASPNYAAVTYPKQYSASAFPFIGPFYPYPQVPLGWRKVSLEWDDGWWFLDFQDRSAH
jgi:BON domain-containing protein